MKKNMSIKIIAAACLCAAIGLTACKAPQLSPDGERAALGVECVFPGFHLAGIRGGRFEE